MENNKRRRSRINTFATDEDGFTLRDFVSASVIVAFVFVAIMGVFKNYAELGMMEQYTFILERFSEVAMTVIISVVGVQVTDKVTKIFSGKKKDKSKSSESKDKDIV